MSSWPDSVGIEDKRARIHFDITHFDMLPAKFVSDPNLRFQCGARFISKACEID